MDVLAQILGVDLFVLVCEILDCLLDPALRRGPPVVDHFEE